VRSAAAAAGLAALLASGAAAHSGHGHEHPDVAVRIDQALFETPAVVDAQRRALEDKVRGFKLELKDDGLHASGKYRIPVLPDAGFEAVAAFAWTGPNVFEVRVRKLTVYGFINATRQVLDAIEKALGETLQNVCRFRQLGEGPDGSRALEVTVDMRALLPALPGLYLSGIKTRDKVLILKAQLP
jgi:hypothetical protein